MQIFKMIDPKPVKIIELREAKKPAPKPKAEPVKLKEAPATENKPKRQTIKLKRIPGYKYVIKRVKSGQDARKTKSNGTHRAKRK